MVRERTDLGAEAVKINGIYIEDAISGFTTLRTTGREALTKEINYKDTKSNGSILDYTTYPVKEIEVEFVMSSTSTQDYRDKYTQLLGMLDGEEADIQFNDDINKFYTGIISVNEPTEKHGLVVVGTYVITCLNPFKYSIDIKEATPTSINGSSAQFLINYEGTYPAHPVLRAEFAGALTNGNYSQDGDCGYVAFMDADENIIQLGNPDAIDLDASKTAKQLVNHVFTTTSGWNLSGVANWKTQAQTGSVASNNTISDTYWSKGKGQSLKYLKPTSYGTGTDWHGCGIKKEYTAETDKAQNWEVALVHRMSCNNTGEIGTFECGVRDASDSSIAGFIIEKTANGTKGTVRYFVKGKTVGTETIDLSYYNTNFGYCKRTAVNQTQWYNKKKKKWQTTKIKGAKTRKVVTGYTYTQSNLNSSIKKSGGVITFKVGNLAQKTYTVNDTENMLGAKVYVFFGANGTKTTLHTNAIHSIKYTRNAGKSFSDTVNVFTAGDIVEADCGQASIYLMRVGTEEGEEAPQYGALANDWEYFTLNKGTNVIQATWSDWVNPEYKPTLKILYNEVYI